MKLMEGLLRVGNPDGFRGMGLPMPFAQGPQGGTTTDMVSQDGYGEKICRFDRSCRNADCTLPHPNGRLIDEVGSDTSICKFSRLCRRKDCFYRHPEGREIDEDE